MVAMPSLQEATAVAEPLPALTRDLEQARSDLDRWGYCLIDQALDPVALQRVRSRLLAVAAAERQDGTGYMYDRGRSQTVNALLNKGQPFIDLVLHPIGLELVAHVLGPDFLLSNTAALIKGPGTPSQVVHSDQTYIPEPWTFAAVANVMWMLDDFTAENGATRVIPGSHTHGWNPPGWNYMQPKSKDLGFQPDTLPVCGPAGTAMVFDGRLWHCGGPNTTEDQHRHGLLTYYAKPFLRQQENFFRSLNPCVVETLSPEMKYLLGFEQYYVLGAVSH